MNNKKPADNGGG
ncbi:putative membrane protein, partial [Yersinia pestis PY-03]